MSKFLLSLMLLASINTQPIDYNSPNIETLQGVITGYSTCDECGAVYTNITFEDGTGWALDGEMFEQGARVELTIDNAGTLDTSDDELLIIEKID